MNCPRCTTPLAPHTLEGIASHRCEACDGLLLPQRELVRLLDELIAQLGDALDAGVAPQIHEDPHGTAQCPQCSRAMTRFGYMESKVLTLDRCATCWLLWFDTGELLTAVQMRFRTTHMAREHERAYDQLAQRMSAIWRATANRSVD